MTAKEFLKLRKSDFENGAVTDEIYKELKKKENLEDFLRRIESDPYIPLWIKDKYFIRHRGTNATTKFNLG